MYYYFILSLMEALLFTVIIASKKNFSLSEKKVANSSLWQNIKRLPWTTIGLIMAVFFICLIVNYFCMPTLSSWGFEGVWIETFFISAFGFWLAYESYISLPDNWRKKEDIMRRRSKLKRWSKDWFAEYKDWFRALPLVITVVALMVAAVQSWEMFHASQFAKRLPVVETVDTAFNQTIAVVDVKKMITVDAELAKKVAEDVLGNNTGLGSKVEIGNVTLQNLNGAFTINGGKKLHFNDDLFWVAPLEHRSYIKYFANKTTPGYVLVDATNSDIRYLVTEVNGRPLQLKYLESALFADDIERHIKSNGYLSKGVNDHCFEIDGDGNPYWVLSYYKQTIGFAGEESVGPITVNAETGEVKSYTIKNAPAWIDRIQPASFVEEQVTQWGSLQQGWWNSTVFSKQENVMVPTPGMTLVYSNGRSYWYTGIKSASADKATNGFMLIDTRTKEAKFYKTSGFNETEAMNIAEGQAEASAAGYHATYPVLYNVRGIPTYFMTYKDAGGNIQGYCFVASTSRTSVGCDKLKKEAARKYEESLKAHKKDNLSDSEVVCEALSGIIRDITLEEGTYYVLINEKPGVEFTGKSTNFPELKWSKPGDTVNIQYKIGEETVVPLDSFDNVNFNI